MNELQSMLIFIGMICQVKDRPYEQRRCAAAIMKCLAENKVLNAPSHPEELKKISECLNGT